MVVLALVIVLLKAEQVALAEAVTGQTEIAPMVATQVQIQVVVAVVAVVLPVKLVEVAVRA